MFFVSAFIPVSYLIEIIGCAVTGLTVVRFSNKHVVFCINL